MRSLIGFILMLCFALAAQAEEKASVPDKYTPDKTNYYLQEKRTEASLVSEVLPKLPKHQREFVENYIKVKEFRDDVLLRELIHPASRACENEDNTDYYDYLRYFYLHEELPKQFRLQLMEIDPKKQEALQKRLQLPAIPTHVMFIEYQGEGDMVEGLQRYLREELKPQPRLYELVKCPDAATLEEFRRQAQ